MTLGGQIGVHSHRRPPPPACICRWPAAAGAPGRQLPRSEPHRVAPWPDPGPWANTQRRHWNSLECACVAKRGHHTCSPVCCSSSTAATSLEDTWLALSQPSSHPRPERTLNHSGIPCQSESPRGLLRSHWGWAWPRACRRAGPRPQPGLRVPPAAPGHRGRAPAAVVRGHAASRWHAALVRPMRGLPRRLSRACAGGLVVLRSVGWAEEKPTTGGV